MREYTQFKMSLFKGHYSNSKCILGVKCLIGTISCNLNKQRNAHSWLLSLCLWILDVNTLSTTLNLHRGGYLS